MLTPEFVEFVPADLVDGRLYISMMYATAVHRCCCGCGQKVVTPLSPTDWQLLYDGECVSLTPSIGNWSFPCRSHYWIRRSCITWAYQWSQEQIDAGRAYDRAAKDHHFKSQEPAPRPEPAARPNSKNPIPLSRLKRWLGF